LVNMPTYTAECANCGIEKEYVQPISSRHITPKCGKCGRKMKKVIDAPRLEPNRFPYVHHMLAEQPILITDKKQEAREYATRGVENGN